MTVTVHGQPSAVLLAVGDLESLEETLAVLADAASSPRLCGAAGELARGEARPRTTCGGASDDLR